LSLSPPPFSHICWGFVSLIYLFKEPAFCFIDSFYGLGFFVLFCFVFCYVLVLVSISLTLTLIFIISPFLLVLDLACSCFSRSWNAALGCLFEIFQCFYYMHSWL
jgi:hypothetical protein